MRILGFNGSNRKTGNTATLIKNALKGAASQGAEVKLINLFDLNFKDCYSCFACKMRNGKSYGRCCIKDDLMPIFREIENSDAIILASPIYYSSVSGEMKSFLDRLFFSYMTYTNPRQSLFPKKINVGFIYTMNITEQELMNSGIDKHLSIFENAARGILGPVKRVYSCDTFQFKDYSKVVADRFDPVKKAKQRDEVFPLDYKKAFDLGIQLTQD